VTRRAAWELLGILAGGDIQRVAIIVSRSGMRGGDMKLTRRRGAFHGYRLTLVTSFSAVVLGSASAGISPGRAVKAFISLGPLLALQAAIAVFRVEEVIRWG